MATCYPNQALSQFKAKPPVLVVLWGDDAGALNQTATQLIAASGLDATDPFASDKLTLPQLASDPTQLPDKASTPPLMGANKRLITFTGITGDESKRDMVEPLTEAIEALLAAAEHQNGLPSLTILPLPRLLEKKSPLVKLASDSPHALCVRFFADTARDLTQHLSTVLNGLGKSIAPDALSLLADGLGADREIATREAEKLALYVGDATQIMADDVLASLAGAIAADAFRLSDAVGRRDTATVDRLLEHLHAEGEDLNGAFTLVIRHLNRLGEIQRGIQSGQSAQSAVASLRPPPPPPQQADLIRQAQNYPAGRIAGLPEFAVTTLAQARGGVISDDLVLRRAILSLSV